MVKQVLHINMMMMDDDDDDNDVDDGDDDSDDDDGGDDDDDDNDDDSWTLKFKPSVYSSFSCQQEHYFECYSLVDDDD